MTHDAKLDPADDPRLTAYALGELPESERAAVEALLASDAGARRFVEETRAFAQSLGDELAAAPAASLSDAQRATIRDRAAPRPAGRVLRVSNWSVPAGLAAAALVAVTFAHRQEIGAWWSPEREVARESSPTPRVTWSEVPPGQVHGAASAPDAPTAPAADDAARRATGYRGPRGEVPTDSREPSEPPPAPEVSHPAPKPSGAPAPAPATAAAVPGDSSAVVASLVAERRALQPGRIGGGGEGGGPGGGGGSGSVLLETTRGIELRDSLDGPRQDAEKLRRSLESQSKDSPENYSSIADNPFRKVLDSALSTFGIDVDTASYANVRRFLTSGQLPPPGAVRIEEMVNYFPYRYAPPTDGDPFAVHVEVAGCPWDTTHRLVRVGLKGREVDLRERPQSNLVFLIDVSGSMQPANKLPLLIESMKQLVAQLDARDRVSIVVYAGAAGVVLPPTPGDQRETILGSLDRLRAGGSTAGGAGIELAYRTAQENFVPGGINRVILATDGDFNVGVSDESSLVRLIEEKAKSKVFLSVLGFGTGNLQDAKMESLSDKGNGNYAYIDSLREGRKVLVEQAAGTLLTIAKDVKLQVEFNPVRVAEYRLLGYENRVLATEDFANDRKDAGDLGAGHTVTALYEIVPTTVTAATASEPLRYQQGGAPTAAAHTGELMTVKLRFKQPEGDTSVLRELPVQDSDRAFDAASPDFHFAASVAAAGMLLRGSPHKGTATFDMAIELARGGLSFDPGGHRAEFVELLRKAKELSR